MTFLISWPNSVLLSKNSNCLFLHHTLASPLGMGHTWKLFSEIRFCNIMLRTSDFRARIFELKAHLNTLVSHYPSCSIKSRRVDSIMPWVPTVRMVWCHVPLEALRWGKGLLFCHKRQRNIMRKSCPYLSIWEVSLIPLLFSPPATLQVYLQF